MHALALTLLLAHPADTATTTAKLALCEGVVEIAGHRLAQGIRLIDECRVDRDMIRDELYVYLNQPPPVVPLVVTKTTTAAPGASVATIALWVGLGSAVAFAVGLLLGG